MPTTSHHHPHLSTGEQAALGFVVVAAVAGPFSWVTRKRWLRGRNMAGPAVGFLVVWGTALVWVLVPDISHRSSADDAFVIVAAVAIVGSILGVLALVAWLVLLAVWECLVWFTHTDGQLTSNRRGHWVTTTECADNKAALESTLRCWVPNLAMGALLAGMGDGWVLGIDLATLYGTVGQPWLWWDQAGHQVAAGGRVWRDDPPGESGFARVAGPVILLWVLGWLTAAWVAAIVDVHSPGGRAALIVAGLAVPVILCRGRIRSAVLASGSRMTHHNDPRDVAR